MKKWCQVIRSAAPVTQNHLSKPGNLMLQNAATLRKSAPGPPNSSDEHFSRTAPATQNDASTSKSCANMWCFEHFRFQTCFAGTFSTSQFFKVLRSWRALYILTSKCASRHNGVHFLDISTSKSVANLVCFAIFDLEMCFAPQWRALFRHLIFQKCSEAGVFCTLLDLDLPTYGRIERFPK